jgi:hypothetical protein
MKNKQDRYANLPAIDSFINFISIILTINAKNNGINSTIASLIAMSFIVGLNGSKLMMVFTYLLFDLIICIIHYYYFVHNKKRHPKVPSSDMNHFNFNTMYWTPI